MKLRLAIGAALSLAAVQPVVVAAQSSAAPVPLEFGVGFGDLARSVSFSREIGSRAFWNNRANVNWGLRASFIFGDGIPHFGVGDEVDTLRVSDQKLLVGNFMVGVGVKLTDNIELAANVDLIGLTLGTERGALLANPSYSRQTVAPVWFNAFGFGSDRTRGSLNSQLYLLYNVSDEFKLKLGFSNLWTDYALQNPAIGSPIRFRSTLPTVFAGVRWTPKE